MPRTVTDRDNRTIHADWWQEGETCTVKRLTFADRTQINALMWQKVGRERAEEIRNAGAELPEEALRDTFLNRLLVGIVSMTDPEGQPLEVTREIVGTLDDRDAQFILDAIHELNPQLTESAAERESFPAGSGDGDTDDVYVAARDDYTETTT